jgi:bis(5'-nucleosidyl)-tetraphosphatase
VKKSAGTVLIRKDQTMDMWLVLMLRCGTYWDFPKGQLERGECELDAAIRETTEETGIADVFPVKDRGPFAGFDCLVWTETEPYGHPRKTARYFLAVTSADEVVLPVNPELGKPEHDEYRWMTFDQAEQLDLHPRVRKVLNWAKDNT